ncbi:uncharacterized protein LOC21388159 [Morus notabilis]|uniref:uncharacterized protein LOC21388159 n=1 Tax=Morus notabilis TaxID=981085 RepID=UPI000CECEEC5|nr:uncharacterized protein LOC21388159 [Morus notabilis]
MSFCSSLSSPQSLSLFSKTRPSTVSFTPRFRASADADVPDFLSADWLESRKKRPFGPRLNVNFLLIMLNEQNTYVSYCSCRFPLACQSYPGDFQSLSLFSKTRPSTISFTPRFRASADADVPDFLSADWLESRKKRPFGPRLNFSAEEAVQHQLDALKYNDQPRQDYGIEVMYRFAGFDPFERSTYFGPFFDLGQFERFRRIFHHSTYRVVLRHEERKILSSLFVEENRFKQRVWIRGSRPEEEEIFQFTMVQRVGGSWDGYWLTESLLHDGDAFAGGLAY